MPQRDTAHVVVKMTRYDYSDAIILSVNNDYSFCLQPYTVYL